MTFEDPLSPCRTITTWDLLTLDAGSLPLIISPWGKCPPARIGHWKMSICPHSELWWGGRKPWFPPGIGVTSSNPIGSLAFSQGSHLHLDKTRSQIHTQKSQWILEIQTHDHSLLERKECRWRVEESSPLYHSLFTRLGLLCSVASANYPNKSPWSVS